MHKNYQNQGYKLLRPFQREGKTNSEDALFASMYVRTLGGIFLGFLLIISGIVLIVAYCCGYVNDSMAEICNGLA